MRTSSSAPRPLGALAALAALWLASGCGPGGSDTAPTPAPVPAPAASAPAGAPSSTRTSPASAPASAPPASGAASSPVPAPPASSPAPSSPPPPPPAAAAARVATLAYGKPPAAALPVIGRFGMAMLNIWPSAGASYMQGLAQSLRTANPRIVLSAYMIYNEWGDAFTAHDDGYALQQRLTAQDWWARDATTGAKVQWTTQYGNWEVNVTAAAPADPATGQTWADAVVAYDTAGVFTQFGGALDYLFVDNVMWRPRVTADYLRTGTNQAPTDPAVQAAFRTGYRTLFAKLRAANPGLKLIGNVDHDLSEVELRGQLEGAFNECLMGKSYSVYDNQGWSAAMARYRATLANTAAPHLAIFNACAAAADPAQLRFGLASAFLDDGWFSYTVDGQATPTWADEYDAALGAAVDPPPLAADASGAWLRRYDNGLVLVNPGAAPVTVTVGTAYRHLAGQTAPNDGAAVGPTVTLAAKSGLFLVKR